MPALLAHLSGILGRLLLAAALVFRWFGVPDARLSEGTWTIISVQPRVTFCFQVLCLGVLVFSCLWRPSTMHRPRVAVAVTAALVVLLFYPYFVMTWSPSVSARASWLNTQHENLSWLGGDIFNEQEYKDIAWKGRIYVVDTERQVGVFRLPNWSPYMIQWGRLPDLFEWLGYSNRFCQFLCRGWFAALAGCALLLLALCRGADGLRYPVARLIGFTGFAVAASAVILALTPPLLSGWFMMRARHAVHRGERESGLRWLEASATVLPAVREDSYFLAQKGLLERALGRDTLESRLHDAVLIEQQGFNAQARLRFEALVDEAPPDSAVRREAVRALVRAGIGELNSGSARIALATFSRVLLVEPCNLKALYTIQLAGLRSQRPDVVRENAVRMLAIYQSFNTLTKAPVIAACYENLASTEFQAGDMNAALALHHKAIGWP